MDGGAGIKEGPALGDRMKFKCFNPLPQFTYFSQAVRGLLVSTISCTIQRKI